MKTIFPQYIDVGDLADYIRKEKSDNDQLQIFEEVFFLCCNSQFVEDINKIRTMIESEIPDIKLPTYTEYNNSSILNLIYKKIYPTYKEAIRILIKKYKLISSIYWLDYYEWIENRIKMEMSIEKISRVEAIKKIIEEKLNLKKLNLLDSIIIRNKLFDSRDEDLSWCNTYITRKSLKNIMYINIKSNSFETNIWIGFPPYATLSEMQKLLKDNYEFIQEYRESKLPILKKRDHRKDNLAKIMDIYYLNSIGLNKTKLAVKLDEKYNQDTTLESINIMLKRIKKESERFLNKDKQET